MSKTNTKVSPGSKDEKPRPKLKMVFAGAVLLKGGKKGGCFYVLSDTDWELKKLPKQLPEPRIYSWKVANQCGRPGSVWEFEYPENEPNTIYSSSKSYVGWLTNDPRLTEWQVEHDTFIGRQELEAKEKKEKSRNLIHERLEPLRHEYKRLVGRNRVVFLAQVIAYITGR